MRHVDRPLAAKGLTSYRYRGEYGWVMIGAKDEADAIREARRSTAQPIARARLEVWTGVRYEPVAREHEPNAFDYQAYNLARKFAPINKRMNEAADELKSRGLPRAEYRVALGELLDRYNAEKDEVRRRHMAGESQHSPNASYYVWVMGAGDEPLDEGPHGPKELEGAKAYARIAATKGVHDRAVSRGLDPTAPSFQIVRRYRAGTGDRIV